MQGYEGRPGTPGGCGLMGTCVSSGYNLQLKKYLILTDK